MSDANKLAETHAIRSLIVTEAIELMKLMGVEIGYSENRRLDSYRLAIEEQRRAAEALATADAQIAEHVPAAARYYEVFNAARSGQDEARFGSTRAPAPEGQTHCPPQAPAPASGVQ